MIAFLIPVFNYYIYNLVAKIHCLATKSNINFEIIVAEDGSTMFVEENRNISRFDNVKHIIFDKNIGRAAIRNRLADIASMKYLLFLDADSDINNDNFINVYIKYASENCVINGGIDYLINEEDNDGKYALRMKYAKEREIKTAEKRNRERTPMTTFNLFIDKNIFKTVRFDENLVKYGYEDLIFGYQLEENGFHISHIDNKVIHKGIDDNQQFIKKVNEGIQNLLYIYKSQKYKSLYKSSRIIYIYHTLRRIKLTYLIYISYKLSEKHILKNIMSTKPSLIFFDFYKLGRLCDETS